jgi:WD40-like Beta Propeller Repeat/Bacterial Ig-like domain
MRRRALLLLTTMVLILVVASGTAMAATENGPIYYSHNHTYGGIYSIDPTVSNPQPVQKLFYEYIDTFDVSRDGKTIVYEPTCQLCQTDPLGPLYTIQRNDPSDQFPLAFKRTLNITNLWDCEPIPTEPDFDCSTDQRMSVPRFSPDGETIYFAGQYILGPDDRLYGIYSVPTGGGAATKIPILNSDGTPRAVGQFGVSHDGTKFAINGAVGVFTVPVTGGVPTRVSRDPCGGQVSPSFSQDDQTILYGRYIRKEDSCTGTGTVILTLFSTPVDNDGTRPGTSLFPEDITNPDTHGSKYAPTYSPDGKYVAFAHWRKDGPISLGIAPATGGSITNLTPCGWCNPVWLEKPPDTTPPSTIRTLSPSPNAAGWNNSDVTVTLNAADTGGSGVKEISYSANGGQLTTVQQSSLQIPPITNEGETNISYYATDNAGNVEAQQTFTVKLDKSAPDTTITAGDSGTVSSTSASFSFSSSETGSTFQCSLDGSTYSECTSPKSYSGLAEGSHTFQVKATDTAGNTDASPASRTWTVASPPDTTIASGPSGYVSSTSASFSFSSEAGSTFQCSRDGASFAACTSPKSYSSLSQGNHTFQVRAIDKAGNVDTTPPSRSWFVDTVVPKGTISINTGAASTASRTVTLRLSASDAAPVSGVASMRFRNGGTTTWSSWFDYSTSKSWTLTAGAGTKTVYVQFKDRAGNNSAAASDTIRFSP